MIEENAPNAPRAIGRPRDERADKAILTATLELMAESGVHDLRVDEVAGRPGVGKATIYRRYRSKDDLITAAIAGYFGVSHASKTRIRYPQIPLISRGFSERIRNELEQASVPCSRAVEGREHDAVMSAGGSPPSRPLLSWASSQGHVCSPSRRSGGCGLRAKAFIAVASDCLSRAACAQATERTSPESSQ